jgi:phage tail-like protein
MYNPTKQFQYAVEVDGLEQLLAQELSLPDYTVDEVEHGEGNTIYRTPGMARFGDLTLSKLMKGANPDSFVDNLIRQVQDWQTGGGQSPQIYLKTMIVRVKDNAGQTIKSYEFTDCWVKQKTGITLSRTTSDNIMEEMVWVVNGYREF